MDRLKNKTGRIIEARTTIESTTRAGARLGLRPRRDTCGIFIEFSWKKSAGTATVIRQRPPQARRRYHRRSGERYTRCDKRLLHSSRTPFALLRPKTFTVMVQLRLWPGG